MKTQLDLFYDGELYRKEDLESELDMYERWVQEYKDKDTYSSDQYYQDVLQTRDALQEALDNYYEYYDEDGNFIHKTDNQ